VSDFGSEAGATTYPKVRSNAFKIAHIKAVTSHKPPVSELVLTVAVFGTKRWAVKIPDPNAVHRARSHLRLDV
jgi:hypothetical protein